jgi:hypothetical protein
MSEEDELYYRSGREHPQTYIENGLCFGFEGWRGICDRELASGKTLCSRCADLAQAYAEEYAEISERQRRWDAGLFEDWEKQEMREGLNASERFEFDRRCSITEFQDAFAQYLRSHSAFILAALRDDPLVDDFAASVAVWRRKLPSAMDRPS